MTSATPTTAAPGEPHPIAEMALGLLRRGRAEPYEIDARGRRLLTEELARLAGTTELKGAVQALVGFAYTLDVRERCGAAAEVLLSIASTAVESLNRQRVPEVLERVRDKAARFARFGAHPASVSSLAPPPAGAMKASSIRLVPRRA